MLHAPLAPADHAFHAVWPSLRVLFPPLFVADRSTSSIEGHFMLSETYAARCLAGVELSKYVRLPVSALAAADCACFLSWPKPLSCLRCCRLHSSLIQALRASRWPAQLIQEVCAVASGVGKHSRGHFSLPPPARPLRSKPPKDLAVAIATFNPCGYQRPLDNLARTVRQFAPLPVYVLELCYSNEDPRCTPQLLGGPSQGVTIYHLRGSSVMFHKENLWQILATRIPAQYSKLAFLDGDILLGDTQAWAARTSALLEDFHILQALSCVNFQDCASTIDSACAAPSTTSQPLLVACRSIRSEPFDKGMAYPSPGYGIAVRRAWLRDVGGLVQTAVVGAGDLFMLGGLCATEHMRSSEAYHKSPFAHEDVERFLQRARVLHTRLGYVPHAGLHLFHGSRSSRQYSSRHDLMAGLQRSDLRANKAGLLEFEDPRWSSTMRKYFSQRLEDE
jgi:hypothetical protein